MGPQTPAIRRNRIVGTAVCTADAPCPKITQNQIFSVIVGTLSGSPWRLNWPFYHGGMGAPAITSDQLPHLAAAPAPLFEVATACRSRAAVNSAWILARSFGSIAASSRL